jgi:hypothetical protein
MRLMVLAFVLSLLAACGGGGDPGTVERETAAAWPGMAKLQLATGHVWESYDRDNSIAMYDRETGEYMCTIWMTENSDGTLTVTMYVPDVGTTIGNITGDGILHLTIQGGLDYTIDMLPMLDQYLQEGLNINPLAGITYDYKFPDAGPTCASGLCDGKTVYRVHPIFPVFGVTDVTKRMKDSVVRFRINRAYR